MRLRIWHGRLDPNKGATDILGNPVDDWGFEGPELSNVTGISYTYNEFYVHFLDEAAYTLAQILTGWRSAPHEHTLEMAFKADCLELYNSARERHEYFGDWDLYVPNAEKK